jgi:hypothetical protein
LKCARPSLFTPEAAEGVRHALAVVGGGRSAGKTSPLTWRRLGASGVAEKTHQA